MMMMMMMLAVNDDDHTATDQFDHPFGEGNGCSSPIRPPPPNFPQNLSPPKNGMEWGSARNPPPRRRGVVLGEIFGWVVVENPVFSSPLFLLLDYDLAWLSARGGRDFRRLLRNRHALLRTPIRTLMLLLVMNKLPDCALRPHWGGGLRRGAPKKLDKRRTKRTKNDQNGDAHFRPSVVVVLSPVPSGAPLSLSLIRPWEA